MIITIQQPKFFEYYLLDNLSTKKYIDINNLLKLKQLSICT